MNPTSKALGADALDFWLGTWSVTWAGGHGTNTIGRILDGRVIEEVFETHSARDGSLYGRSLSVRDSADGIWRQTWVDSSGAYLDFTGTEVDGQISFVRTSTVGGRAVRHRMIWTDITPVSMRWEWQTSQTADESWTVLWPLEYRRAD